MTANHPIELDCAAPSTYDRIHALAMGEHVFELNSQHPRTGIYQRNGRDWAMIIAYVEGEIRVCRDAVNIFILEKSRSTAKKDFDDEFSKLMKNLQDTLLLHSTVVKAARDMALASPPSKRSMDDYRIYSGSGSNRPRAVNGDSLLSYGLIGEPVPYHVATFCNEDFDPVARFIADWLMDPFLELIIAPFRSLLPKIPIVGKRMKTKDRNDKLVDAGTIEALAKALMVMIAILCLTTAIFTLEEVKRPKVRILVVALFAQTFALPIQFLGSRSLPLYTLICTYFQAMVVFVGTTSGQSGCH